MKIFQYYLTLKKLRFLIFRIKASLAHCSDKLDLQKQNHALILQTGIPFD
jgi:hypothetical protein